MLNLLLDLKREFGLTYIFISHDLNVVRFMADRVMVMYLGKVAEIGAAEAIFDNPASLYDGAARLDAAMDPDERTHEPPLTGDPPNPINPPPGCRFHTRCVKAEGVCSRSVPPLFEVTGNHAVACLMPVPGSGHSAAPLAAEAAA